MTTAQNGKGSKPRPLSIPRKQLAREWERIFGKKKIVVDGRRKS